MAFDLNRYRPMASKKINRTYSVPLDEDTLLRLKDLKDSHGIHVGKWIRDLILENLPEMEKQIAG